MVTERGVLLKGVSPVQVGKGELPYFISQDRFTPRQREFRHVLADHTAGLVFLLLRFEEAFFAFGLGGTGGGRRTPRRSSRRHLHRRPQGYYQHQEKMVILQISFLILCSLSQATGCFRLVTPSKWGAKAANCSQPLRDVPAEYVVIIHTAGNPCRTHRDCHNEVKMIQNYHMSLKGWCDIAYSFLIGEDGYVYEGRGWRSEGSHTYGYNDLSLGIAFIGTFVERSPEDKAWKALRCFLDFSVKIGYLSPEYIMVAHSDVSDVVSPGEFVRAEIAKWPNYKHSLYILNRSGQ